MKYVVDSLNPIKSPSLFQLTEAMTAALGKIEQNPETGELTNTEDFEALALDTEEKLVSCACAVTNFQGLIDEIEKQEKALSARKKFVKKLVEKIENKCVHSMQTLGIKSLKTAPISMSLRRTSAVNVFDPDQLDNRFFYTPPVAPRIDKRLIKTAIESGEDVHGAKIDTYFTLQVK